MRSNCSLRQDCVGLATQIAAARRQAGEASGFASELQQAGDTQILALVQEGIRLVVGETVEKAQIGLHGRGLAGLVRSVNDMKIRLAGGLAEIEDLAGKLSEEIKGQPLDPHQDAAPFIRARSRAAP